MRVVSRWIRTWGLCAVPALLHRPLAGHIALAQTVPARTTGTSITAASGKPVQVTRARGVTVERSAVVVRRNRFDPRDPPAEMPPLGPHADAVPQSRFGCAAAVQYTVVSRRPEARGRRG